MYVEQGQHVEESEREGTETMLEIEMKKSSTIFQEDELMTRWLVGLNMRRIA